MRALASSRSAFYHGYPVVEADVQHKHTYRFFTSLECASECEERSDCSFFSYSKTYESCTLEKCFNPLWLTSAGVGETDDQSTVYIKPEDVPAIRTDLARGKCWLRGLISHIEFVSHKQRDSP